MEDNSHEEERKGRNQERDCGRAIQLRKRGKGGTGKGIVGGQLTLGRWERKEPGEGLSEVTLREEKKKGRNQERD